tara:strand:+ start:1007 stop:1168 length:162 start_codon:yes stop_codon:yes gene_type:complete
MKKFKGALCDLEFVTGAKIIDANGKRTKIKYFCPRDGDVVRWVDDKEIKRTYV